MKFKSQVYTEASGSIGGVTYSHNLGGMYTRARAIPTNPNSPQQMAIRAIVSDLTNKWGNLLTPAQRTAWATYAANVPIPDKLGEPILIPPLAHYIRCNVPRVQGAIARVDDAPGTFDLGSYTAPTIVAVDAAADTVQFGLTIGDLWNVAGGGVLLYTSRPQNPTVNYFKGPYRYATSITGPGAGTPQTKDLAFPCAVGQKVFFQFRFTQGDGRLALPFLIFGTAS